MKTGEAIDFLRYIRSCHEDDVGAQISITMAIDALKEKEKEEKSDEVKAYAARNL